jgi:Uma2 family endonuclease
VDTQTGATIEDLSKVEGKPELVHGEIVEMPPAGDEPNRANFNVAISLHEYEKRTGSGRVYTDGTGFHTIVCPASDALCLCGRQTVGRGKV